MYSRSSLTNHHTWLPISAGLVAVVLWAVSFIAIKFALSEMQPITMIWLRILLGALTVAVVAWRDGRRCLPVVSGDLPKLGAASLIGVVVHQELQANGMMTTTATVSSWLSALAPVLIVVLAWLALGERLLPFQLVGLAIACSGALLVSAGNWQSVLGGSFGGSGDWMVVASALAWAVYTVMTKSLVQTRSPLTVTFSTLTIGWLLLLPQVIYHQSWVDFAGISWVGWTALLVLGVGSTGLAHLLYNYVLQSAQVVLVAALQYVEPFITVLLAFFLLGEHFTLAMAAGGGLIIVGVWMVETVRNIAADN